MDDRRCRKNLVHSFCQKSWILERLRVFEKHRKFDFFQRSLPWTKKGNDGRPATATTDVGDDRRRRRPTTTKTTIGDGEKISCTHFAKNLEFQKDCEFLKNHENLIFFKGPSLGRKREMMDARRRRRPTSATTDDDDDRRRRKRQSATAKKSRALILPKILNFRKIASFWKTSKIWFFSKVPPLDEKGKWWTTDDVEKIFCTHFAKNLEFQKDCEFLKNHENLIFFKGPSLGRKREMMDDRRRRKNLVHSFCQKSWILERLRVFEKHRKFDFFQRSLPWTKKGNDGRRRPTKKSRALILPKILNFRKIASFWKTSKIWFFSKVPPLDEKGKWRTTDDVEKISCTHFAKNLEF